MTFEEFANRVRELTRLEIDMESAERSYNRLNKCCHIVSIEEEISDLAIDNAIRALRKLGVKATFDLLIVRQKYNSGPLDFVPQDMPYDNLIVICETGEVATMYMLLKRICEGEK